MRIDKRGMDILRRDIDIAFAKINAKHSVNLQLRRGKYNLDGLSGRFTVTVTGTATAGAQPESVEALEFKRTARLYGLTPDMLGTKFGVNGVDFVLTGSNRKRRKFPLSGMRVEDSKGFKFPRVTATVIKAYAGMKK